MTTLSHSFASVDPTLFIVVHWNVISYGCTSGYWNLLLVRIVLNVVLRAKTERHGDGECDKHDYYNNDMKSSIVDWLFFSDVVVITGTKLICNKEIIILTWCSLILFQHGLSVDFVAGDALLSLKLVNPEVCGAGSERAFCKGGW